MEKSIPFSLITILSLLFYSCNSNTFEYHPNPERYPYANVESEVFKIDRKADSKIKEEIIFPNQGFLQSGLFEAYFKIDSSFMIKKPDLDINTIKYGSLNSSNAVVLNSLSNTLLQYNNAKDDWFPIAETGRGPGELMFTTDFSISNSQLYVSTKDSRISVFDCLSQNCSFKKTVSLEKVQPTSIAIKDKNFVVQGLFSSASQGNDNNIGTLNSIHIINRGGDIIDSFGEFYDIKKNWMLIRPFENGEIKYIDTENSTYLVQYFEKIPELYVFENKKISQKYTFNGFVLSKNKYNTKTHELFVNVNDWSSIDGVVHLGNGKIIVTIKHLSNRSLNEFGIVWDMNKDFYLIDLPTNSSSFVGSIDLDKENLWFSKYNIMYLHNDTLTVNKFSVK